MIPLNDKKNMIRLIKRVNKTCIYRNICKAIKDNLSFKPWKNHNKIVTVTKETWPLALARCLGGHGHEQMLTPQGRRERNRHRAFEEDERGRAVRRLQ